MDNAQTAWVDACLETLNPAAEWLPDSEKAFKKLLNRQQKEGNSRWIRVSSVGAILAGMFAVLALLPWHFLWNPQTGDKSSAVEPVKAAPSGVTPPAGSETATLSPTRPPATLAVQQSETGNKITTDQPLKPAPAVVTPPLRSLTAPPSPVGPSAPLALQQAAAPAREQEEKPAERVGNGVTAPSCGRPKKEPAYTDEARSARIQGTVTLEVIIGVDGTAKDIQVVKGLGYGLDESARAFAEQFRCEPGTKEGKPVAVAVRIDVNFHLY